MEDFQVMQSFQASNCLYENLPNDLFFKQIPLLLISANLLKYITIVCIFHHYTNQG